MAIATINPATGDTIRTFEPLDARGIEERLERAQRAFHSWSRLPVADRARVVARAGALLEERREQYGRLMTLEMGKLLRAAMDEAAKCALACRYYAEHGPAFIADQQVLSGDEHGYVAYHPLGPVLAVMPWNFPFWQVIRFAAPALVAGNVGLLKHASNVPQCALAVEALFRDAGAPDGVFQTLLVGSDAVAGIVADPRITAVSLTGSEGAGTTVAAQAGRYLKKTVLELGGSDPFIVMPSAKLDQAVEVATRARTINNGQSCIAAKRFIVHERIADDFEQRFVRAMAALTVGDPMDAATQVGPLASRQLVDDLAKQVDDSVARGARVLTGGRRIEGRGFYFQPTVLADIPRGSPAYDEETFGPVASLFRVRDVDHAIQVANDTRFGLGSSVWTTDPAEAARFARGIDAGTVFVNAMVASDPRFPFGGVKASGFGRELAELGLREFVNVKTVRIFGLGTARAQSSPPHRRMTQVLSASERQTLALACDTFMPRLVPGAGDDARLFSLGADDIGLAAAVEQALESLSRRQRRELALFLRLLESRAFMLAITGRARSLGARDAVGREAVMRALASSRIPQLRAGFQALKRLSTFLFYSALDSRGSNPTWASLGYTVPAPRPARARLVVATPTEPMALDADACVIGSGAGGGVVAARLAAAGMRVVVLEAGPADQAPDFDQREVVGMQRLYLDQGTTATRDLGVSLLAGRCVGGGTTVNWQTSLRLPDYIRAEWAERSGIPAFSDGRFDAATDRVCARLGVSTAESRRNGNNSPLERGCAALGYRWREIPRNARGCDLDECSYCVFGCRVGGKQSTATTYLWDAQQSGDVRIVAGCRALRVRIDAGRAAGVDAEARDDAGRTMAVRVRAPVVVAACGALETPALLLRSRVVHPAIGRNLFLHPTSGVAGRYDDRIEGWIGAPQTVLCDEFDRLRGNYGVRFETAPIHPGLMGLAQPWHGARHHRAHMQHVAHASAFIVLARDARAGHVTIDAEGRAVVHYTPGIRERALLQRGIVEAARVHWAAGASEIHTLHVHDYTFQRTATHRAADFERYLRAIASAPVHGNRSALYSAHQMGTCRMGTHPRDAVCDDRGAVRGVTGLYVADASLFPASSGVNPMITVMALAQLVGDAIAERGS